MIAEIQGYAAGGGGLGLVCASDIVVAGESARFMAGATRVGMAPDGGTSVVLPRLIGLRRAMEMLLSNRIVGAPEALEMGLITRLAPDQTLSEDCLALARTMAAGAPKAMAATKRLLWNGVGLGVEACLPEEARTVAELSASFRLARRPARGHREALAPLYRQVKVMPRAATARALVTGGAAGIGAAIVRGLRSAGHARDVL